LRSGITLTASEAVAIARAALMPEEPDANSVGLSLELAPSLADALVVEPDGTVVCLGYTPQTTVSDIALFLRGLLPEGPGIPGGLRYAIARALHEVDAPPFESAEDFSRALARFQDKDSPDIGRPLTARAPGADATARVPFERRRPKGAVVTNLRHALREADVQLFEHQRTAEPDALPAAPAPSRARGGWAIAAGIAAAVVVFSAGAATRSGFRTPAPPTAASVVPAVAQDIELEAPRAKPPVKALVKSKPRMETVSARTPRGAAAKKTAKTGFFERMHLQWLRKAFS
jgi:hypothetical protein